jgi:hypothetical protein
VRQLHDPPTPSKKTQDREFRNFGNFQIFLMCEFHIFLVFGIPKVGNFQKVERRETSLSQSNSLGIEEKRNKNFGQKKSKNE